MNAINAGLNLSDLSPTQREVIARAKIAGGLVPTYSVNTRTIGVLMDLGLVRRGFLREDAATVEAEIALEVQDAKRLLLEDDNWDGARRRLENAYRAKCQLGTHRHRLTEAGMAL